MRVIEIELSKSDLIELIHDKYFKDEDIARVDISQYDPDSLNSICFKVDDYE
jgi:hypothetical protein